MTGKPVISKVCEHCGTAFDTTDPGRRACGKSCGAALARADRAANRARRTDEPDEPRDKRLASANAISSSGSSGSYGPSLTRPELGEGALYGLPGDVVQAIGPHTEGDPAALLLSYLTMLGNACGPQPSVSIGADHHPGRLYTLIVGDSATGRKGTAGSEIERLFDLAAPDWFADRIERGIQSAEAVVARAGDTRDPRLLLTEFEFGRLLATMARRPNLPSTLKEAWDGRPLSTITKDPANRRTARGAHVSIIGHITAPELADRLSSVDIASGYANRFLFASVNRSKLLPRGGSLPTEVLDKLADETREVVDFAHDLALRHLDPVSRELCAFHGVYPPVELERTEAYFGLWDDLYMNELQEHPAGVSGIVTSRAEAQVTRLSVVFALADRSEVVDLPHLEAALAVWRFCQACAVAIFGTFTGNRDADRVLRELRNGALTRKDISVLFSRNKSASQLDRIMAEVMATGLVDTCIRGTGRRATTVYSLKTSTTRATSAHRE